MTPLDYYNEQCKTGIIFEDPQQIIAIKYLQKVYTNLLHEQQKRKGIFSVFREAHLIKGVYLWGGVGIGKTFMMDCFYRCLPFPQKLRMHFHQFMQLVHDELTKHQGEKDPLQAIAKNFAKQTYVLCFDEFFVSDITDAMILGQLFKALFANGVCLVTTSNVSTDNLYKTGLQRVQFLSTIDLLKKKTEFVNVLAVVANRLRWRTGRPLRARARVRYGAHGRATSPQRRLAAAPTVIRQC